MGARSFEDRRRRFDLGVGSTYSINNKTKSPQASAEFLNYYFSPETQATSRSNVGSPPHRSYPIPAAQGIDPRQAAIMMRSTPAHAGDYGYTTWTFFPPKTDIYIYEEIEKVWAGDKTVEVSARAPRRIR